MRNIAKKLKNRRGETIAEVLVSLLIGAMAILMLATMVASATKIITSSSEKMKAYVIDGNNLAEQSSFSSTGTVTFKKDGVPVKLTDKDSISVQYYVNSTVGDKAVVSYRVTTP